MCFGGRAKEDEAEASRSRELDKQIRADEKRLSKEVKLLLLGTDLQIAVRPCTATMATLTFGINRSWRIRKVYGFEADEVDLCTRFQQK